MKSATQTRPREVAGAERLPALIGQREGGQGAQDRRRGAEAPGDRAKDRHPEQQAQQRRPDEGIARQARGRRLAAAKSAGKLGEEPEEARSDGSAGAGLLTRWSSAAFALLSSLRP